MTDYGWSATRAHLHHLNQLAVVDVELVIHELGAFVGQLDKR